MATTSRKHGERGPAPPGTLGSTTPAITEPEPSLDRAANPGAAPADTGPASQSVHTLLELVDRATDHPLKTFLLLLVVCCPLAITYTPAIVAAFLAASGASSHALTYLMLGNVTLSSSLNTAVVITLRKTAKSLRILAQDDGNPPSTHP